MSAVPPAPLPADPPYLDGERAALEAWLEFHRRVLWRKCAGLTAEQLGTRAVPPSSLSLRGLLRHMTDVERGWYRRILAGEDAADHYASPDDPDADLNGFAADDPDGEAAVAAEFALFQTELDAARAAAAGVGLDDVSLGTTRRGERPSLRWVHLHLIEEYARHNGHADLLRERIDGAVGD
ncbi:DinB family protein [Modestobacter sp. NPDC049651]|uniref:DinB family protein n=1 Tax=unclassified Modestobacter TaxID=2643866 RepID=UPI0033E74BC0